MKKLKNTEGLLKQQDFINKFERLLYKTKQYG